MKEILIYSLATVAALIMLGYSMHMLVGGLVSRVTEFVIISIACLMGLVVISYMVWDVVRRRRNF